MAIFNSYVKLPEGKWHVFSMFWRLLITVYTVYKGTWRYLEPWNTSWIIRLGDWPELFDDLSTWLRNWIFNINSSVQKETHKYFSCLHFKPGKHIYFSNMKTPFPSKVFHGFCTKRIPGFGILQGWTNHVPNWESNGPAGMTHDILIYPAWKTYKKLLKIAIEIVDLPIRNSDNFHSELLVYQLLWNRTFAHGRLNNRALVRYV